MDLFICCLDNDIASAEKIAELKKQFVDDYRLENMRVELKVVDLRIVL
jgi:hypothetical protein